jgi:hypothetical protein
MPQTCLDKRSIRASHTRLGEACCKSSTPRYSIYLLYWYKSTNTDTCSPLPKSQLERVEKLAATSFMKNLHLPLMQAKAQLGFLNFVVEPLWG